MTVTGLVVNYRTPDLTARAVTSLLGDGVEEVIVVDNGSRDDSVARLHAFAAAEPRIVVSISNENAGFGAGMNQAAERARGSSLFLLNSDAVVQRGTTALLAEKLAADETLAVAAPIVVDEHGDVQHDAWGVFPTVKSFVLRTNRRPPVARYPEWVSGVAMLVRTDAFRAVGGFDQRFFMYFEDVDLCRRLAAAGYRIVRVDGAQVVHAHGRSRESTRRFLDQYYAAQDEYTLAAGWNFPRRAALRVLRTPIRLYRHARA